jgi:hypothetical protein
VRYSNVAPRCRARERVRPAVPCRAGMGRYPVWAGMGRYGPVWAVPCRYGPVWAGMGRYGRYGPVWAGMGRYGPVWTGVAGPYHASVSGHVSMTMCTILSAKCAKRCAFSA